MGRYRVLVCGLAAFGGLVLLVLAVVGALVVYGAIYHDPNQAAREQAARMQSLREASQITAQRGIDAANRGAQTAFQPIPTANPEISNLEQRVSSLERQAQNSQPQPFTSWRASVPQAQNCADQPFTEWKKNAPPLATTNVGC